MWIPMPSGEFKSSTERVVTAVRTRSDVSPTAKRLDPKALDLVSLHVSSYEMDPEDFRKNFGVVNGISVAAVKQAVSD